MIGPDASKAIKGPPPSESGLLGIDAARPSAYHRVIYAAVVEHLDEPLMELATPQLFMARSVDAKRGVVVAQLGGPDDAGLAKRLEKALTKWAVKEVTLVVVGLAEEGAAFAKAAKPMILRGTVAVGGFGQGGASWGELPEGALSAALEATDLDWAAFSARVDASQARLAARASFGKRLAARPTRVTYALVAVNVLFFGLQVLFGGSVDPTVPLLVRMGGVSGALVSEGEVWRLISSAFLHGGLMHLGFNMFVLVIIGRLIERVIGPHRFLILYTACALAGALASALIMDAPVSVGASGALWGVLAAEGVLAFAPGFLPASIVPAARRAALINLVLNIANSFRPHVDWAAHAGGGVMGAALLYLVLSRGVPRGEALASEEIRPMRFGNWLAGACAVLLAVGAIAGPVMGRAWEMREPAPRYERVAVPELGASLEVPVTDAREVQRGSGYLDIAYGDLVRDRALVSLRVFPVAAEERGREREIIHLLLNEAPDGATVTSEAQDVELGAHRATRVRYRFENGLRLDRVFILERAEFVRFDAYYWSSQLEYARPIVDHVASSWRRSP